MKERCVSSISEALSGYFVKHFAALREQHPGLIVQISSSNHASDLMRGEAGIWRDSRVRWTGA